MEFRRRWLPASCVGLCAVGLLCGVVVAVALAGASARSRTAAHPSANAGGLAGLPIAARGPVSAALGADLTGYRIVGSRAINPAQRLSAAFSAGGVSVVSGNSRIRLSLAGLGRGGMAEAVRSAALRVHANRVTYARGSLSEWWANGPLGLEQGFVVAGRPAGRAGPLTLALALSDNTAPRLKRGSVLLGGGLRYGGLVATDNTGRVVPARLTLRSGRIVILVDDRGARYPVRIDPFVQQTELTAADGYPGGEFASSMAASGDTIVVGALSRHVGGNPGPGALYVFVKPVSGWANAAQTAELTASDGAPLGYSVAISGGTIVSGAPYQTVGGQQDQGAAYVFVEPPTGWTNATQTAELTASDGAGVDYLGSSVAVSGGTIVAGAPAHHHLIGPALQGAAYVFVEPPTGWANATQTGELTASDAGGNDNLGWSVAASGSTIVAGAPEHGLNGAHQGAAYVFVQPQSGWASATQTAELTASDGASADNLGRSVAISGSTIVAGAPDRVAGGRLDGAAYVFVEPASGWTNATQTAELTPSRGGGSLGSSVVVSGATVVAGAPYYGVGSTSNLGAAYVFVEPASGWTNATQTAKLTASDGGLNDFLGWSVAVSGGTILVGASGHNSNQGVAYAFANPPKVTIVSPVQGASYAIGQSIAASYSCTPFSPATILSCSGPVADGASFDTTSLGSHKFTVQATDSLGITANQTVKYTVISASAPPVVVSGFTQSHQRWREGKALPTISATARSKSPVGTVFSFTLSVPATVKLAFSLNISGRKVKIAGKSRCVRQTKRNKRQPTCALSASAGAFSLKAGVGTNQLAFQGRIKARHKLAPGNYTVTITASANGKISRPQRLRFTIVR